MEEAVDAAKELLLGFRNGALGEGPERWVEGDAFGVGCFLADVGVFGGAAAGVDGWAGLADSVAMTDGLCLRIGVGTWALSVSIVPRRALVGFAGVAALAGVAGVAALDKVVVSLGSDGFSWPGSSCAADTGLSGCSAGKSWGC